MSTSTWRQQAAPIIRRVLRETEGKPEREIRRALLDAYPFGLREYHPYKIWLDEIARQLGKKPPLGTVTKPHVPPVDPRQGSLFEK